MSKPSLHRYWKKWESVTFRKKEVRYELKMYDFRKELSEWAAAQHIATKITMKSKQIEEIDEDDGIKRKVFREFYTVYFKDGKDATLFAMQWL
jgi:hypothetical protein